MHQTSDPVSLIGLKLSIRDEEREMGRCSIFAIPTDEHTSCALIVNLWILENPEEDAAAAQLLAWADKIATERGCSAVITRTWHPRMRKFLIAAGFEDKWKSFVKEFAP